MHARDDTPSLAGALALAMAIVPARADACSIGGAAWPAVPEDGATNVPVDVRPAFYTTWPEAFDADGESSRRVERLVRLDTGENVPVVLHVLTDGIAVAAELEPVIALEPDAHYQVEIERTIVTSRGEPIVDTATWTFRTGSERGTPPATPSMAMEILERDVFGCGSSVQLCAAAEDGSTVLIEAFDPAGSLVTAELGDDLALDIGDRGIPTGALCFRARGRSKSGALSDAPLVCASELAVVSDGAFRHRCRLGRADAVEVDCSVAGAGMARRRPGGIAVLGVGVLAALVLRRRRRISPC